jgi:DNA-binding CsgD family transcriptional regulator
MRDAPVVTTTWRDPLAPIGGKLMLAIKFLKPEVAVAIESLKTARSRRIPHFAVVNHRAEFIFSSQVMHAGREDAGEFGEPDFPTEVVAMLIAEIEDSAVTEAFAVISPTEVLRATPLASIQPDGPAGHHYALSVEYVEPRNLLANACERFGLSQRELEVLRHVLHGLSTAEISEQLCIAETTVHAHVKNIARKTNSTKRTEIVAKLLGVR